MNKATLNNLPIYYLSLFKAPKGVIKDTELLQTILLMEKESTV